MPSMPSWLERYRCLPRTIHQFAIGQFLINLVHASQFLLLNLFLRQRGLEDPEIAALTSQRFVATLLLAIPAGLWLRGKPLRKPLLIGSILFPISALASLEFVRAGQLSLASFSFLIMGFGNLLLNVASLPMAMRLTPEEQSSESLSLLFASWAAASVCGGFLSTALQTIGNLQLGTFSIHFDEHATLLILNIVAALAPIFYARLPDALPDSAPPQHWLHIHREDWPVLLKSLIPTLCIATGAGLSIQFLNLFFRHVFHLESAAYSGYGTVSNILVFVAGLIVPEVKRRLGWRGAILGVQSFAVILLVVMGLTEWYAHLPWALTLALICMVLRQPLMSMAGPSTSELTMQYVGERNRELVSACNGAIWSGAWWLAARTFQILRTHHFPYWQVFVITGILYAFGTLAYLILIRQVERRPSPSPLPAPPPEPL